MELKLDYQYIIPFAGLSEGTHEFTFTFDKKFFDDYPVLETRSGLVSATVLLEKTATMLSLQISMSGNLEIPCDRCLDYFYFPIEFRGELLVKFNRNTQSGTDEIWILDPDEHELNLKQYFYECIGLCMPIQRVHPKNRDGIMNCNPDMLNILASHHKMKTEQETDPRWNKLKELLNDNNN